MGFNGIQWDSMVIQWDLLGYMMDKGLGLRFPLRPGILPCDFSGHRAIARGQRCAFALTLQLQVLPLLLALFALHLHYLFFVVYVQGDRILPRLLFDSFPGELRHLWRRGDCTGV